MVVVEEENVIIQAGNLTLTIFPKLGGKIASIRLGDHELLQAPLSPYGPRTRTMPFDASDASGWDECLPSVASCTVETADGAVSIPDHGDLWRVVWTESEEQGIAAKSGGSIKLRAECFSLPLTLERTVTLSEVEGGAEKSWQLRLEYTLTNRGQSTVPWSWAAHPLFVADAGDRVILPHSITELTLEGSGGGRLGQKGDQVNWPIATTVDGEATELSVAHAPQTGYGDKLFAGPLASSENWCVLERPQAGVRIRVNLDPVATPYLGMWLCYGGWPDRPGPKQVCVAMEPCTAPVDSLASSGIWSRQLTAGESAHWSMSVDFEIL